MKFSLGDKVYVLAQMDGNPFISPYPLKIVAYTCRGNDISYHCKCIFYNYTGDAFWQETVMKERDVSKTREVLEERVVKMKKAR